MLIVDDSETVFSTITKDTTIIDTVTATKPVTITDTDTVTETKPVTIVRLALYFVLHFPPNVFGNIPSSDIVCKDSPRGTPVAFRSRNTDYSIPIRYPRMLYVLLWSMSLL